MTKSYQEKKKKLENLKRFNEINVIKCAKDNKQLKRKF